jgi:hypothetical protein
MRLRRIRCSRTVKFNVGDFESIVVDWSEEHILEEGDDPDVCRRRIRALVSKEFRDQLRLEIRGLKRRRKEERDEETKCRIREIDAYLEPPPQRRKKG